MKHYLVELLTENKLTHVFGCWADDFSHANEQAENAYPEDTVIRISLNPQAVPPRGFYRHTPGPWSADYGEDSVFSDVTGAEICEMVAGVSNSNVTMSRLELEANSRLIAAAPEMLRLLQQGSNILSGLEADCDDAGVNAYPARHWWQDVDKLLETVELSNERTVGHD